MCALCMIRTSMSDTGNQCTVLCIIIVGHTCAASGLGGASLSAQQRWLFPRNEARRDPDGGSWHAAIVSVGNKVLLFDDVCYWKLVHDCLLCVVIFFSSNILIRCLHQSSCTETFTRATCVITYTWCWYVSVLDQTNTHQDNSQRTSSAGEIPLVFMRYHLTPHIDIVP